MAPWKSLGGEQIGARKVAKWYKYSVLSAREVSSHRPQRSLRLRDARVREARESVQRTQRQKELLVVQVYITRTLHI